MYEIAGTEKLTINAFIDEICRCYGEKKVKVHIPLKMSLLMAWILERLLGAGSPLTQDIVTGLNEDINFEIDASLKALNLIPSDISEAVLKSI